MKRILLLLMSVFIAAAVFSQDRVRAYLVSNAHFDSQWNWDVQRSIREYIPKTLDQNLFLLGTYPDYVFNFEGGIKYQWMKEYYPHQYELIKRYIREGRWHVTGSTWDATDPNIPSAESFTRNILYGQHFYRREFGVEGTDIFLPDCFGFGWTLPTIAAHSGLIGFSTQKLMWRHRPFHGTSKIPFEIGLWQGVDGSRIMAVMDAHNYTTKWRYEDLSHSKYLQDIAQVFTLLCDQTFKVQCDLILMMDPYGKIPGHFVSRHHVADLERFIVLRMVFIKFQRRAVILRCSRNDRQSCAA